MTAGGGEWERWNTHFSTTVEVEMFGYALSFCRAEVPNLARSAYHGAQGIKTSPYDPRASCGGQLGYMKTLTVVPMGLSHPLPLSIEQVNIV